MTPDVTYNPERAEEVLRALWDLFQLDYAAHFEFGEAYVSDTADHGTAWHVERRFPDLADALRHRDVRGRARQLIASAFGVDYEPDDWYDVLRRIESQSPPILIDGPTQPRRRWWQR